MRKAPKLISKILHLGNCKQNFPTALTIFNETIAAAIQSYIPDESSTVEFLNYSANVGSYQIPKPHFLQTITLETQKLMVIRSRGLYELWVNVFKHGKQKEFPTAKKLQTQIGLALVRNLLWLYHRLLKIYLEKDT